MEIKEKAKTLFMNAISYSASDIHFVPMEKNGIIRFRIDGKLYDIEKTSVSTILKLISHLKFIANMDVGERRRPQNGSLAFPISNKKFSMRLSTFPSSYSETLVIRVFPQNKHPSLQELAIFPKQADKLLQLMNQSSGLIVVSGPTGCGKTTTIYSLLNNSFQQHNRNIITIEDPVEKKNDQFLQMEINERAGITYSVGLRSLLRHDPDLIMIGEIRDTDTAKMAIRASLTGHLVLSSIHSKDSISALSRLHELGIPYNDLRESLKGIISQRLVNLICPFCGGDCQPICRRNRKMRRGAIYEILTKEELYQAIEREGYQKIKGKYSLSHSLCKAIALGFVDEKEFDRFD